MVSTGHWLTKTWRLALYFGRLLKGTSAEGYRLRLYVPSGQVWRPYYMPRLAERPANVFFILRNLLRQ
jgi:proline dehydrogenase